MNACSGSLRSKTKTAMHNEVLCKIRCYNLIVLTHEMYKQGVAPIFWMGKEVA
jgi:hypothetical protein